MTDVHACIHSLPHTHTHTHTRTHPQLPHLPQLAEMTEEFFPYYVFTAVRKFMFFLDPMKKDRVTIDDLCASDIFEEFNQLRAEIMPADSKKDTWFSSRSAWQVYACYLQLDTDHNGMLSKKEFQLFNGGSLTSEFVDRLFEEHRMYRSREGELEMDYKTFLNFVLAVDNKASMQSIKYLFKILDMHHVGYLDVFTLSYFFRAVHNKMNELGHDVRNICIDDVVQNEIFDMVQPARSDRITLEDLSKCKCAPTIFSILTDVNGFWKYDNRETLLSEREDDES
jgi:serine/threonine-protein phosphatase 2A regulatory subunit B''